MTWKTRWMAAAGLSLLFMLVYGGSNTLTSTRSDVGTICFSWERFIPFVPWMTIPYLSIDFFFFGAPFLVSDRKELLIFSKRIIFVILVAALCYLAFPLTLAEKRPEFGGWLGKVWAWFIGMDQPHNLMPSLHIALRTVLAAVYARHSKGAVHGALAIWFSLIGFSTLLTHQHHVIDVFMGFLLGLVALQLFSGLPRLWSGEGNSFMAKLYGGMGALLAVGLVAGWPGSFWLLWLVLSFGLAAAANLGFLPAMPRKRDGRLLFASRCLWAPVLLGQWLSWHHYRRKSSAWSQVVPGVTVGRLLTREEIKSLPEESAGAVLDLTSEFSENPLLLGRIYHNIPLRDLTAPTTEQMAEAAEFVSRHAGSGVYVHCKAGYSRSVAAVGAYLLKSGSAGNADEAMALIRKARPEVVIRPEIVRALRNYEEFLKGK